MKLFIFIMLVLHGILAFVYVKYVRHLKKMYYDALEELIFLQVENDELDNQLFETQDLLDEVTSVIYFNYEDLIEVLHKNEFNDDHDYDAFEEAVGYYDLRFNFEE